MNITKRIANLQPSATLRINELSNKLAQEGKEIFKLGFGQSPFPVPESVVEVLKNKAHRKEYLPVRGLQSLRETVAEYYQRTQYLNCDYEDVLISPGSKMYLFITLMAYEGDLLLPAPSWVSYFPQAIMIGRKVHWLPTYESNGWKLTADDLDDFCKKHDAPKVLLLNYPNNPTGITFSEEEIQALAKVARKYGIIILSDEIYGELHHEGLHLSMAQYYPEGTIISSGLSKWAGAGGWRLGTFLFPKELAALRDVMATIASETFTTASAPIQYAAVRAFQDTADLELYRIQSRKILKAIGNYTHQALSSMNITTPKPEGGFYSFINFESHRKRLLQRGIANSLKLSDTLLRATGIALLPSIDFGRQPDELLFRMAYVDFDGSSALKALNEEYSNKELDNDFIKNYAPKVVKAMTQLQEWL